MSPEWKKGRNQHVFSKRKLLFIFPAGAAAGDSEAMKDEQKIRLGGRNELKPARPESVLRRRRQGNVYARIKNTL